MRSQSVILLTLAVAAALTLPVLAQGDAWDEPDLLADAPALAAAGYADLAIRNNTFSHERGVIDRTIVAPFAQSLGVASYGFAYAKLDLTGDGADDLVVVPKIPGLLPPDGFDPASAATFIFVYRGGNWDLAIEGGAFIVGTRPSKDHPGAFDLALAQEDGIIEYRWDGSEYVRD